MANKRISLVDPNKFTGQALPNYGEEGYNISVPLEDLNILVELETYTKARTVLTTTANGNTVTNKGTTGKISFIEGKEINGRKYLTNSYADLTTDLSVGSIDENLGITDINIDFSSSYAPMVTIQFIDVRGSAVFQKNATTKYGVFFKLPYPIFSLKIKGYYGKPVQYCLHMTKVNSKFNTDTGNFEITASFIGYTYAMLSDMLLGYLKALPYTQLGKDVFKELNDRGVLTLNQLMTKVSFIGTKVPKILSQDDNYIDLQNLNNLPTKIDAIRTSINGCIIGLSELSNVIYPTSQAGNPYMVIRFNGNQTTGTTQSQDPSTVISAYSTDVNRLINDYNQIAKEELHLDENDFSVIRYDNVTLDKLNNADASLLEDIGRKANITDVNERQARVNDMIYHISKSSITVELSQELTVYDFSKQYELLTEMLDLISTSVENAKAKTTKKLRQVIDDELGFTPTIRNIVEIFTSHVEAFFKILFEVSRKAKEKKERTTEFKNKNFVIDGLSDINTGVPNYEIYPWPEFAQDGKETYLGSPNILDNPLNVPEIEFVEDLYSAILKATFDEQSLKNALEQKESVWFPVNPIDTQLFNPDLSKPYKRVTATQSNDIIREVMLRAVTFLGISNYALGVNDIEAMAEIEALQVLENSKSVNNSLIESISLIPLSGYTNITGIINSKEERILKQDGQFWNYNYILSDSTTKLISLSKFSGDFNLNDNSLTDCITNYNDRIGVKGIDNGMYFKILSNDEYEAVNNTLPSGPDTGLISIKEKLLKEKMSGNIDAITTNLSNIGFNVFSGKLGIQELSNIEWDNSDYNPLLESKLNLLFYEKWAGESNTLTALNVKYAHGLSSYRQVPETTYDVTRDKIDVTTSDKICGRSTKNILGTVTRNDFDPPYKQVGDNIYWFTNIDAASYPYLNFVVKTKANATYPISLFGSNLYNHQPKVESKALLFLHTLPWNISQLFDFSNPAILNLFAYRAAFIKIPSLWSAFIGGLLWRYESNVDPIEWTNVSGSSNTYLPNISSGDLPRKDEYMTIGDAPMSFENTFIGSPYKQLGLLTYLPQQVKNEFISDFKSFVINDFPKFREQFEIVKDGSTIVSQYSILLANIISNNGTISKSVLESTVKNIGTYNIVSPILERIEPTYETGQFVNNFFLQNKDTSAGVNLLKDYLGRFKWVANITYRIWPIEFNSGDVRSDISILDKNLIIYINKFINTIKDKKSEFTKESQVKEIELQAFGSNENPYIKLNIYRTLKAIYDKWIGGNADEKTILFPDEILCLCGNAERQGKDKDLAARRNDTPRLIDSFRFIDRAFNDIGDQFLINPLIISKTLMNNSNQSFYDFLSRLLTDNNFDFVALPSFINYNDPNELESIFKPMTFAEQNDIASSGPSFVCVYVGQTSTKLDFGDDPEYKNDGVDLTEEYLWPPDFQTTLQDHEDTAAAFIVRYGQQNQNVFKDITLDQSEFGETDESLQITNAIAQGASDSTGTYAGQNLYNVFSVRSYKAEIEMLGNAMIQPMMYFQLSNIPMFHGAYLITSVKHSIRPNYMSTRFSGVRIKYTATPLLQEKVLYSSILGEFKPSTTIPTRQVGFVSNPKTIPRDAKPINLNYTINYQVSQARQSPRGAFKDDNPEYIVVHWTAGEKYHPPVPNDTGYHIQIKEDGTIIETGDLTQKVSHAGCKGKTVPCAEMNSKAIGIAYVGGIETGDINKGYVRTWDDWQKTELNLGSATYNAKAQWEGLINAILLAKYTHPSIDALTSHHLTAADKIDVGDGFPWDKLISEIEKRSGWRPLFADTWYDSGGSSAGKKVRDFKGNVNKNDLLTQLQIEQNQPIGFGKSIGESQTKIFNYLYGKGLNKNLVIGIMANMYDESRFNPKAGGDSRPKGTANALRDKGGNYFCSWGLTQLNVCGGRGVDFLNFYNKNNAPNDEKLEVLTNTDMHLDFVAKTAKDLFPATYTQNLTPEKWTEDWAIKYENCGDCGSSNSKTVVERVGYVKSLKTQDYYLQV